MITSKRLQTIIRLILYLSLVIVPFMVFRSWVLPPRSPPIWPHSQTDIRPIPTNRTIDWNMSPLPTLRSTILPYGSRVACWPSTGGIWIKHVPPVELDYLALSRTNDTPRPDPPGMLTFPYPTPPDLTLEQLNDPNPPWGTAPPDISEEDLFCQIMRTIGADFWELPEHPQSTPIEYYLEPKHRNELAFWWERWGHATSLVNLTEASIRLGEAEFGRVMMEYNSATCLPHRRASVEKFGSVHCRYSNAKSARGEELCKKMWCKQYPEQCEEVYWDEGIFHSYYRDWAGYGWYARGGATIKCPSRST